MKWGRKKPSSSPPSSSRPSFTSHVFPYSWLTKFKQMSIGSGDKHGKGKRNSVYTTSSSQCAGGGLGGRFHEDDADAFWRPSFGEDSVVDGKKNRGVQEPVRHDMEEEPEFPPSTCQSCRSDGTELIKEDIQTFRSLVSDARCLRGLPREKEAEIIRTPRNQLGKDKRSKKANQRAFEVKQRRLNGDVAENFLESQSGRTIGMIEREDYKLTADDSRKDYNNSSVNPIDTYFRTTEEDCQFIAQKGNEGNYSAESQNLDWQRLKEIKIEELKAKNEKQRKSEYISRETQRKRPKERSKGRAHSPRTASKVEVCKIKALEDMKKARLKKKKKAKDKIMEEGFLGLESFAVVKSSFDPQKDFRDSMMEMIRENRISQPEELEELLACYLTLNSDEYHDLIIKVFRQVWFDLNDPCSDEELDEHEECFYDYRHNCR